MSQGVVQYVLVRLPGQDNNGEGKGQRRKLFLA
jgi:hypothetical protein